MQQPFLFKLTEQESPPSQPPLSLNHWFADEFGRRKLESPFGYLLLAIVAMFFAWQIGNSGWVPASIWLVILLAFPLLMAAMFNLKFGLYLTVFSAFSLMGFKKMMGDLPLGIFLDACIMVMIFGLIPSANSAKGLAWNIPYFHGGHFCVDWLQYH